MTSYSRKSKKVQLAFKLDDFNASNSWLQNFIKKYNNKNCLISEELNSANFKSSENFKNDFKKF